MGYTPAFDSIYTGTLYGKWPTAAVWASLLPLIDARGEINLAPEAIAGMTGWPLDLLLQGIEALCQPDPRSRSKAEDGRRLLLIDAARDWGWRVVNHGLYREKARLLAKSQREVGSGSNRSRMGDRRRPPETAGGVEGPPPTAKDRLSDSNTDSNKDKKPSLRSGRAPARARSRRCPPEFIITAELRSWAREACPHVDIDRETESFRDHEFRNAHSDWVAVWRQWMRRSPEFKRNGGPGISKSDGALTWRPGPDD